MASLEAVLTAFLDNDNDKRRAAEAAIEAMRVKDAEGFCVALMNGTRTLPTEKGRQTASVILRRILFMGREKAAWAKLSPAAVALIQSESLLAMQGEAARAVRLNVLELVAEIDSAVMDTAPAHGPPLWGALWALIKGALATPNVDAQECALLLLERRGEQVAVRMTASLPAFAGLLSARLADAAAPKVVRSAAARAAVSILVDIAKDEHRRQYALAVLPPLVRALEASVAAKEDENSETYAGLLSDAADDAYVAVCFKPFMGPAVAILTGVARTLGAHVATRRYCLLALERLAINVPSLARQMAPARSFLEASLAACFQMAVEWGDQPDDFLETWEDGNDETDEEELDVEGCNVDVGFERLAAITAALGTEYVRKSVLEGVARLTAAGAAPANWKMRYAAITAMEECSQIVDDEEEQHVAAATKLVAVLTTDPHPRVRMAAAGALGALMDTHSPRFQHHTHTMVAPAIIRGLADPSKRVRAQVCSAVLVWAHSLDEADATDCILPYLPGFMPALMGVCASSAAGTTLADVHLREVSLTAVAAIAAAVGAGAGHYYPSMRDALLRILMAPDPPAPAVLAEGVVLTSAERERRRDMEAALHHTRLMRGKALEAISVVGAAAGPAIFAGDARQCLQAVVGLLRGIEAEKEAAAKIAAAGGGAGGGGGGAGGGGGGGGAPGSPAAAAGPTVPVRSQVSDNPSLSYIWDTFARLTKVLGPAEISAFLPVVIPRLIAAADAPVVEDVSDEYEGEGNDDEDEDDEGGGGGDGHATLIEQHDGTVVRVRTANLDDKVGALASLGTVFQMINMAQISSGGGLMATPSIMATAAPSTLDMCARIIAMEGDALSDVRSEAMAMVDDVFISLASAVRAPDALAAALDLAALPVGAKPDPARLAASPAHLLVHSLTSVCLALSGGLEHEGSADMLTLIVQTLRVVVRTACSRSVYAGEAPHHVLPTELRYLPLLPASALTLIIRHLVLAMRAANQRRIVRSQELRLKKSAGEADDQEERQMGSRDECDSELMAKVTEALGMLLCTGGRPEAVLAAVFPAGTGGAASLAAWPVMAKEAMPDFQAWAAPGTGQSEMGFALSLVVDVLEFVGEGAGTPASIVPLFAFMIQCVGEKNDMFNKQAASYGCGALAGRLLPLWPAHLNQAMQGMAAAIASFKNTAERDMSYDTIVASMLALLVKTYPAAAAAAAEKGPLIPRNAALRHLLGGGFFPLCSDEIEAQNAAELVAALVAARDTDAFADAATGWDAAATKRLSSCLCLFATTVGLLDPEEKAGAHHAHTAMRRLVAGSVSDIFRSGWVPGPVVSAAMAQLGDGDRAQIAELLAGSAGAGGGGGGGGGGGAGGAAAAAVPPASSPPR